MLLFLEIARQCMTLTGGEKKVLGHKISWTPGTGAPNGKLKNVSKLRFEYDLHMWTAELLVSI